MVLNQSGEENNNGVKGDTKTAKLSISNKLKKRIRVILETGLEKGFIVLFWRHIFPEA